MCWTAELVLLQLCLHLEVTSCTSTSPHQRLTVPPPPAGGQQIQDLAAGAGQIWTEKPNSLAEQELLFQRGIEFHQERKKLTIFHTLEQLKWPDGLSKQGSTLSSHQKWYFQGFTSTLQHTPQVPAAMASAMPSKEEVARSSPEVEEEAAVKEVTNLTLVSSACEVASTAYASTKESHPCVRSVCDTAEKGVRSVTEATASCVQPVLTALEPHVAAASEYASKSLDKLGEKLPILQKPVAQVLSDTKELVSCRVAEVKDDVTSRMMEVVDVTEETLQSSVEAARSAVTSSVGMAVDPGESQADVCGAKAVLERTEGDSLLLGDEEVAKEGVSAEGSDTMSMQQEQRYFVRLGSLSEELRLSVYLQSTAKVKQICQETQEILGQLHCIFELIEAFKLQEGQEKLHQMWLNWSKKCLKKSGDESFVELKEAESLTLFMARTTTHHLQLACWKIVLAILGLPSSLQAKMEESLGTIKELSGAFSVANSLQDLPSSVMTQSQGKLAAMQEYMEELLDYLKNNTPLSWLVGPLSSRELEGQEEQLFQEDQPSQERAEIAGAGQPEHSTTLM
ncbi:perilipin-3-like [Pithys albifrons albifrons]|uniref:perilipin-3-like n=1 Tax=Pithys albifrons albifrons TaxID=3385563 RepID=UPI003A5D017A